MKVAQPAASNSPDEGDCSPAFLSRAVIEMIRHDQISRDTLSAAPSDQTGFQPAVAIVQILKAK